MSTLTSRPGRGPSKEKNPEAIDTQAARFASVKEFAQLLGISEATVWRRIADGTITSVKFGGTRRIDVPASLARFGVEG